MKVVKSSYTAMCKHFIENSLHSEIGWDANTGSLSWQRENDGNKYDDKEILTISVYILRNWAAQNQNQMYQIAYIWNKNIQAKKSKYVYNISH